MTVYLRRIRPFIIKMGGGRPAFDYFETKAIKEAEKKRLKL